MTKGSERLMKLLRSVLPSPFTIAVGLTALAFVFGLIFTGAELSFGTRWLGLVEYWADGLWSPGLLVFAVQMMLMLVLGHVLALSAPIDALISSLTRRFCNSAASAVFTVSLLTVLVALYNWGLGLIFGAIFARKVGEHAVKHGIKINYALIGAAGYSGLMVWHGGFSGSSLAKVAEPGHLSSLLEKSSPLQDQIPEAISYSETVFGTMNLSVSFALILLLPLFMWWMSKRAKSYIPRLKTIHSSEYEIDHEPGAADRLDRSKWIAISFGGLIFFTALYQAYSHPAFSSLGFINPNWINLSLLGLGIVFHGRFDFFLNAIDEAISGAAGILIQFPLYFGIMGLMSQSGLVEMIAEAFVEFCRDSAMPDKLYPILTFFSAGLINIFVPSGGGQWAIQGPIIVQAATELKVPLVKSILAMAYGDQLTNMLQPFWALPLLGITGLRARDILPYTLALMLFGIVIFIFFLLIF
jgi:short-chain fatty acids transporter